MSDLNSKIMLVDLSISVFGGVKVDRKVTEDVAIAAGSDKSDSGKYGKFIISKHALASIQKVSSTARTLHADMTLPWDNGGARLLSVTGYFPYLEAIKTIRDMFYKEVDLFIKVYPNLIEQAKTRLNGMFRQEDYPPIDELRERFKLEVKITPMPNTQNWLLDLAEEEMVTIRKAAEEQIDANMKEAVADVFRRIGTVTEKMVSGLNRYEVDPETGKTISTFRDSLVENVREMVASLPMLNITGDETLSDLARTMNDKLCKMDADALRRDPDIRKQTAEAAQEIFDKCQPFMS